MPRSILEGAEKLPPGRFIGQIEQAWHAMSLAVRLVTVTALLLATGLTTSGIIAMGILQAHLVSQVDAELISSAQKLSQATAAHAYVDKTQLLPSNYYVRVMLFSRADAVVLTSPYLPADAGVPNPGPLLSQDEIPNTDTGTTTPITILAPPHNAAWRVVAAPILDQGRSLGVVTVALPLTGANQILQNMGWYLLILSLVLMGVGVISAYYLVRRAMRPLRAIEAVAGRIADGDLSQRVTLEPPHTEVGSLARSLNRMLSQIEQSFSARKRSEKKMRQFISDASHELRTPLAAIRGYGELYRMGGVNEARVPEVMGRIESEATRMGALVQDLLALARLDESRQRNPQAINLVKSLRQSALDLQALDSSRQVKVIGLDGSPPSEDLIFMADSNQITQVFSNLAGNIVRHTPEGSPVEFAVGIARTGEVLPLLKHCPSSGNTTDSCQIPHAQGGSGSPSDLPGHQMTLSDNDANFIKQTRVVIEVRDHGPGVSAAEAEQIFERFYRTDSSRSRQSGGSGLGLAIVASIVKSYDGRVCTGRTEGGGLTIHLEFPLEQA